MILVGLRGANGQVLMVDLFLLHRENVTCLREKLARTTDDGECQCIVRLIEAEE